MTASTEHQNAVFVSLAAAAQWWPVPWEGGLAATIGGLVALTTGLGPIGFVAVAAVVLGGLLLWRRFDHHRADYFVTKCRRLFGSPVYTLVDGDRAYRPLSPCPAGYRHGLVQAPGRTLMRNATPEGRFVRPIFRWDALMPSPLSESIPVWDVLEDEDNGGLLITPTGGTVMGYAVQGLHTVYTDTDVILQACERLYFAAARLPDHWQAQFVLHAQTAPAEALSEFLRHRAGAGTIGRTQAKVRARYLADKQPRHFQLRLYVSRQQAEGTPFRAKPDPAEAEKAAQAAEQLLTAGGLQFQRLSAPAIFADVAAFLQPGRPQPSPPRAIVGDESPRAALIQAPVTWTPDAVRIGGQFVKVLTLAKLQGTTAFTDMELLFLDGLPFDFRLVTYVHTPPRVRTRAKLELLSRMAYASAAGARVPNGLAQTRFEELRGALESDQAGEQRVAHLGMQVAVWGASLAEVQQRAGLLQERLLQRNYTLLEETGRHDRQYLTCMVPGGVSQFDRWIPLLSNNVVDLLPLFDSRPGDDIPACLFETDRGELWAYDPAAAHRSNWNSFVVGASGSGKSVLVNALIANACLSCAAAQGRVLIVDFAGADKSSYLMLAQIYGGRFLPILSDGAGLNPFPPRADALDSAQALDAHTENALTVLVDLLVENQQRTKETKLYRNLIQEAVRALYAGDREPCFASFLEVLAAEQHRAPDPRRASLLRLLTGTLQSPGGRLFMSTERLVADDPFVIFDLFGIESYTPEIREAIVFTVCDAVRRLAFSSLGGAEKKKYIVLDEVAQLVRQDGVVSLIQELYATARKHGTSVTTVTQKYTDFVASGLAETVRSNSTTGVFLSHATDAASRDLIARDMSFNGRERHLFESLHVKKGVYSEFLLRVDDGPHGLTTAKLRLGLPPLEYELYTSDVEDRRRQARIQTAFPEASTLEVLQRAARRPAS